MICIHNYISVCILNTDITDTDIISENTIFIESNLSDNVDNDLKYMFTVSFLPKHEQLNKDLISQKIH